MAITETVEINRYGYSDNPVYDHLIKELANLAGLWRRHKTMDIAERYDTVLRALILIGFGDELPVDVELPEELMPVEYISLFTS